MKAKFKIYSVLVLILVILLMISFKIIIRKF